jgi:hypothetical protein
MMECRTLIHAVFLVYFFPGTVSAVSLGHDCEPSGLVAKGREVWNPIDFWTTQIREIQEYVDGEKTAYRLSMIERKRDKINERLDAKEMRAMGIEQYSDPEIDREMAKLDRELLKMDRQQVDRAIKWGRKCTEYAKRKLSKLE